MLSPSVLLTTMFALVAVVSASPAAEATSSALGSPPKIPPPLLDDGNPRPRCNVTDDCWIWMVARCNKMGGDGLCVMTSCSDEGYCFGLCPPNEDNVTQSTSTTTGYRCKYMEIPPKKTRTETSTSVDHFEKLKWRLGMPNHSGGGPVETFPTVFPPGQEPTSSQTTAPSIITNTWTSDTTLATSTRVFASSWKDGMFHLV